MTRSACNPVSGTNTLEQSFRLGVVETRKRIASRLEDLLKAEPEIDRVEIVKRIRSGELDCE